MNIALSREQKVSWNEHEVIKIKCDLNSWVETWLQFIGSLQNSISANPMCIQTNELQLQAPATVFFLYVTLFYFFAF
jgi:hypothetical protein